MKKRYILAAALVAAIACVASLGAAVTAHADERLPKFKAGFMMDAATGTAVFEHNADERLPIASMVKIMTLLLCFEELDNGGLTADGEITVSQNAASMGGSQAFLDANCSYKTEELLKSIVVASANDSCVAMAEHIWRFGGKLHRPDEQTGGGTGNGEYVFRQLHRTARAQPVLFRAGRGDHDARTHPPRQIFRIRGHLDVRLCASVRPHHPADQHQ